MSKERRYGKWAGNPNGTPEDETRCIQDVSNRDRSMGFHQCYRKRGHGPDGLYCFQHAPVTEKEKTVYFAELSFDKPIIAEVDIGKETDRAFSIIGHRNILGNMYISKYARKRGVNYFNTKQEAIDFLINALIHRRQNRKKQIDEISEQIVLLSLTNKEGKL